MHGRGAHLEGLVRVVVSSGQVREEVEVHSCRAHGSSLAGARPYRPGPGHKAQSPCGRGARLSIHAEDYSSTWQVLRRWHHQGGCGIGTSVGDQSGYPRGKRFRRFYAQRRGTGSDAGRISS
jgi:hypothetical protein